MAKKGTYRPSKKVMKGSHKIKGTKKVGKKITRPTAFEPWGKK